MDDLISRQALCEYALNQKDKSITPNDIMRFPSAQPDSKETSPTHKALDTISRQAALNALSRGSGCGASCHRAIKALPSAQPETHEERTETHACDCISRQAAIDICNNAIDLWHGQLGEGIVIAVKKKIEELPSAQPEIIRCKDCKYNSNTCGNYVNCDIIPQMFGRTTDNFCSMAKRKEGTDESD